MAGASIPIRIDRELDASARQTARAMSRSVSEQVSHWARLGRELERSPDVSVVNVQAVLSGDGGYDSLNPPEQAVVRTAWNEQIESVLSMLDLAAAFETEGHSYAELDDDGKLRIVKDRGSR